jgi:hypothetical protein
MEGVSHDLADAVFEIATTAVTIEINPASSKVAWHGLYAAHECRGRHSFPPPFSPPLVGRRLDRRVNRDVAAAMSASSPPLPLTIHMPTRTHDDPGVMTPEERIDAIAALLAEGVLRIRRRCGGRLVGKEAIAEPADNRLEVSREMPLDGTDGFTPPPRERTGT